MSHYWGTIIGIKFLCLFERTVGKGHSCFFFLAIRYLFVFPLFTALDPFLFRLLVSMRTRWTHSVIARLLLHVHRLLAHLLPVVNIHVAQ